MNSNKYNKWQSNKLSHCSIKQETTSTQADTQQPIMCMCEFVGKLIFGKCCVFFLLFFFSSAALCQPRSFGSSFRLASCLSCARPAIVDYKHFICIETRGKKKWFSIHLLWWLLVRQLLCIRLRSLCNFNFLFFYCFLAATEGKFNKKKKKHR